jgi:hypothetical protein
MMMGESPTGHDPTGPGPMYPAVQGQATLSQWVCATSVTAQAGMLRAWPGSSPV